AFLSRVVPPQRGYVYVGCDDPGAMAEAKPGARAQIAGRSPPWIVVDHDLASVTVARWPGVLWHVGGGDPLWTEEQGGGALVASGRRLYARCGGEGPEAGAGRGIVRRSRDQSLHCHRHCGRTDAGNGSAACRKPRRSSRRSTNAALASLDVSPASAICRLSWQ